MVNSVDHMASAPRWRGRAREVWCRKRRRREWIESDQICVGLLRKFYFATFFGFDVERPGEEFWLFFCGLFAFSYLTPAICLRGWWSSRTFSEWPILTGEIDIATIVAQRTNLATGPSIPEPAKYIPARNARSTTNLPTGPSLKARREDRLSAAHARRARRRN